MENIVNIQIHLEDDEMNEFVKRGINGLTDDKIGEVLLEGFKDFLNTDKGKQMFYYTPSYSYGSHIEPSAISKDIIQKATDNTSVFQNEIDEISNKIIEYLDKNAYEIVKKYIIEAFTNKLFSREDRSMFEMIAHRTFDGCN